MILRCESPQSIAAAESPWQQVQLRVAAEGFRHWPAWAWTTLPFIASAIRSWLTLDTYAARARARARAPWHTPVFGGSAIIDTMISSYAGSEHFIPN